MKLAFFIDVEVHILTVEIEIFENVLEIAQKLVLALLHWHWGGENLEI